LRFQKILKCCHCVGWIVSAPLTGPAHRTWYIGGRGLGGKFLPNGDMIICEPTKGLIKVDVQGNIEILTMRAGDREIRYANDLDVSTDGSMVCRL